MLSANVEQRVNIKFLTKLGKSATETYNLLTEVYGDQCLSRTHVFEWFKKFKEVGNTSGTIQNRAVLPLRKLRRMWRRSLELFEETADWAFEQFLKLPTSIRKVLDRLCTMIWAWERCVLKWCQKSLPLSKRNIDWIAVLTLLKTLKIILSFFLNVIMCDETWIYQYDPETKRQSMHWRSLQSPRKKARMSKSKFKAMIIFYFDIRGVIYID